MSQDDGQIAAFIKSYINTRTHGGNGSHIL